MSTANAAANLTASIARNQSATTRRAGSNAPTETATEFTTALADATLRVAPSTGGSTSSSSKGPVHIEVIAPDPGADPRFSTTRKVIPMSAEERAAAKAAEAQATYKAAQEKLVEWSQKTYAEQLREIILEEMHLTEEDLAAKPPEEREAIEREIARRIEERLGKLDGKDTAAEQEGQRLLAAQQASEHKTGSQAGSKVAGQASAQALSGTAQASASNLGTMLASMGMVQAKG